jgi:hypothetical protein
MDAGPGSLCVELTNQRCDHARCAPSYKSIAELMPRTLSASNLRASAVMARTAVLISSWLGVRFSPASSYAVSCARAASKSCRRLSTCARTQQLR